MSDYNLPPGVTARDIDRAAGAYEKECERCGDRIEARLLDEVDLCPGCVHEERQERSLSAGLRAMSNSPDEE